MRTSLGDIVNVPRNLLSKGACGKARCQVENSAFTYTNLAVFE